MSQCVSPLSQGGRVIKMSGVVGTRDRVGLG